MAYNKIIFLVETPILTRYYERYGIETLRNMGFEVTIFDLSPVLLPTAYRNIRKDLCDYDELGFKQFYTMKSILSALGGIEIERTLVICSMGYQPSYWPVFRKIKKQGIHFCYFMQELSSSDSAKINTSLSKKNILRAILRRIPWQLQGLKGADFIIGCGNDEKAIGSFKKARLCESDSSIVYFHSSNYEECLIQKETPRLVEMEYCVFIDQYMPYHPDNIDKGLKMDASKYYSDLNRLFELIESQLKCEVIVAAHPRSDYELHPNVFENRKIIKNCTCRLIKDCNFVIYHFSNSLGYVALFKKPVLQVINSELLDMFGDSIEQVSEQLGIRPMMLDDYSIDDIKKRLKVNTQTYYDYVQKYMKKDYDGSLSGIPLWQAIGEYIKTI